MNDLRAPQEVGQQTPALAFDEALEALNDQQRLFVWHYLRDPVGSKAVRRADYSQDNPAQTAQYLLSRPDVARAVRLGMELFASLSRVEIAEWLSELKIIAECDVARLRDHFDDDGRLIELPGREHERRALKRVVPKRTTQRDGTTVTELTLEAFSKLDALRLLGTYAGFLAGENVDSQPQAPTVNLVGLDVAALLSPPTPGKMVFTSTNEGVNRQPPPLSAPTPEGEPSSDPA